MKKQKNSLKNLVFDKCPICGRDLVLFQEVWSCKRQHFALKDENFKSCRKLSKGIIDLERDIKKIMSSDDSLVTSNNKKQIRLPANVKISPQMYWENLLQDKCPTCGNSLKFYTQHPSEKVFRVCQTKSCKFAIGSGKMKELVNKMISRSK
jgi:rRNA maturation protein Nop10